ncbi:hypothetical protein DUI87_32523 [Hirundo rustica rustica]|uniref:Uncharacterized protein n=1 Tax=Hirundo rustica rustica TaxID=333673 RepID=A0A3M0IQE9_HIRRU|nr:hypothetical protein DUI87_32523 [Hirundo rustica rustica]
MSADNCSRLFLRSGKGGRDPRRLHGEFPEFGAGEGTAPAEDREEYPKGSSIPKVRESQRFENPKGSSTPKVRVSQRFEHPKGSSIPKVRASQRFEHPKGSSIPKVRESQRFEHPKGLSIPKVPASQRFEYPKGSSIPKVRVSQRFEYPKGSSIPKVRASQRFEHPKGSRIPKVRVPQRFEHPKGLSIPKVLQAGLGAEEDLGSTSSLDLIQAAPKSREGAGIGAVFAKPGLAELLKPKPGDFSWKPGRSMSGRAFYSDLFAAGIPDESEPAQQLNYI